MGRQKDAISLDRMEKTLEPDLVAPAVLWDSVCLPTNEMAPTIWELLDGRFDFSRFRIGGEEDTGEEEGEHVRGGS
jgi:hypothetical protein